MNHRRPRLLFLSQCLPFPPTSGVTNRTYHILRELQRGFEVSLVAFSRLNHQPDAPAREAARASLAKILANVEEPTSIPGERSRVAKMGIHARSLCSGRAYVDHEYDSEEFGDRLAAAIKSMTPDFVHLDSLDLHRWIEDVPAVPVACTHHSIESTLLTLRGDHHPNRLARWYLRLQASRYLELEERLTPVFATNVMMSELDAARLRSISPGARTVAIPNGVDPSSLQTRPDVRTDPDLVAFLGPSYMYPNRDGMRWFLEETWPLVLRARPSTRLAWIGRMGTGDRERFERHPRVQCLGFVEDLEHELATAACLIVPLRIGGGTRLKILDAWAAGKAVVSTNVGCEGLEAEDGRNILTRDDSTSFAEALVEVLDNSGLRQGIGEAARHTVEVRYAWSAIGDKLNGEYFRILGM